MGCPDTLGSDDSGSPDFVRGGIMKRHFKFIGGPWDGEYHEIDTARMHCVNVPEPPKFSYEMEPLEPVLDEDGKPALDEDGDPVMRVVKSEFKSTRYILRHMAGESGNVYWFQPDDWGDMYALSQFIHHYQGLA